MQNSERDFLNICNIGCVFLDKIWDNCKGKLDENDLDELGSLLGSICGCPGSNIDWKEAIKQANNDFIFEKQELSMQLAFNAVRNICLTYYDNGKGYKFPGLIDLLQSMIEKPSVYKNEWNLWQQSINEVVNN